MVDRLSFVPLPLSLFPHIGQNTGSLLFEFYVDDDILFLIMTVKLLDLSFIDIEQILYQIFHEYKNVFLSVIILVSPP